jgi:hypothetical protein
MASPTVVPQRRFLDEATLRAAAVDAARFACNGAAGRVLGDPVFELVTEGRNRWKGYSACGDLAHYVLRELGYRDERVLNRDDDGGEVPWKVGANLSRLVFGTGDAFVWAKGTRRPKPGDILYVAPPEHVCVLEELDEQRGTRRQTSPRGGGARAASRRATERFTWAPACCAAGWIWLGSPDFSRRDAGFRSEVDFSLIRLGRCREGSLYVVANGAHRRTTPTETTT